MKRESICGAKSLPLRIIGSLSALALIATSQASLPASGSIAATGKAVTWKGTAKGTGALNGESDVVEGVNADTFTLAVAGTPNSWAGKTIRIRLNWTNSAEDYDFYVHKGTNTGPLVSSGVGGLTNQVNTENAAVIDPGRTGTGVYTIHMVYSDNVPVEDQPTGTAEIVATTSPMYLKGSIGFSPNTAVFPAGGAASSEPSNRTDSQGNHYACGIRGFPAGCDMWYYDLRPNSATYDPFMRNPQYRGLPDGLTNRNDAQAGGDGGGDIDLAVSPHAQGPNGVPLLAYASLIAANISTGNSNNLAQSYQQNPAGNTTGGPAADDRQWLEFFGDNVVYLYYRTLAPAASQVQQSTDGGLTFGPTRTAGFIGQADGIAVDQKDGTVYISGSSGSVAVGIPDETTHEPLVYNTYPAATDPNGVAHLFFVIRCASNGTVYGCYSNDKNILLIYSKDHGKTWSHPLRINDGPTTATAVFPALAVSPSNPDTVGISWYGTSDKQNDDNANWAVFYAQVNSVTTNSPIIRQVRASDHFIHAGNISEQGFGVTTNANRNLSDYFQISFDPLGAAVIDFTDDHNDRYGNVFSTRQVSGQNVNGTPLARPVEGSRLPAKAPQLSPDGAQVVDARDDVTVGAVGQLQVDSPLDILSIKYSNETTAKGDKVIVATMKVSSLADIAPLMNWRINFAANAPFATLSETNMYSNALSDRGDQFYMLATAQQGGTLASEVGTMVRNSDGSVTYAKVGVTDYCAFDPTTNSLVMKVAASKLNPSVAHGPKISAGTILTGLRGSTNFTTQTRAVMSDITPGGTQYTIQ